MVFNLINLNLFFYLIFGWREYLDEGKGRERRWEKNREKMRGERYKWFLIWKYKRFDNDKMTWERKRFKFISFLIFGWRDRRGDKRREK